MHWIYFFFILSLLAILSLIYADDHIKYTPKNFCVRLTTNTTAVVQWFEPVTLRDEIMGYTIYHTLDPDLPLTDWNFTATGNYPLATLRNIELGEVYTFRIRLNALNMEGPGPLSEDFTVRMVNRIRSCYDQPKTSAIRSLNILRASATSYTSVEVWWNVPYDSHLHTGYCVTYGINNSNLWQNVTVGLEQAVELTNLQQYATYTISLAIMKNSGLDHFVQEITVKVQPEEIPLDLIIYDITSNSFALKWSPPTRFRPIRYKITYDALKEYVDSMGIKQRRKVPKTERIVDGYITDLNINELLPNTNYSINITAVPVDHSYRPAFKTTMTTKTTAPPPLVKPDINGAVKGGFVQVLLPKASEEFGPVGFYYIVVVPQSEEGELPSDIYLLENTIETNSNNEQNGVYIAAKFVQKIPYAFILGNGEKYEGHTNHKLKSDVKYRMFVRAVVDASLEELFTDSPLSDIFYLGMPEIRIKTQNL